MSNNMNKSHLVAAQSTRALALILSASAALGGCAAQTSDSEGLIDSTEQAYTTPPHPDKIAWIASRAPGRQFNSRGAANHILTLSPGHYKVVLKQMGGSGGNVQVSADGSNARCKVVYWVSDPVSPADLDLEVLCRDPSGGLTDSDFVLSFADFSAGAPPSDSGAYLWMEQPIPGPGTPSVPHQWGAPATVAHNGTGKYTVELSGLDPLPSANVQVTATGQNPEYCKVAAVRDGGGSALVDVSCFAPDGVNSNSAFSVRYYRDTRDSWVGSGGFARVLGNAGLSPDNQRNVTYMANRTACSTGTIAAMLWAQGVASVEYTGRFDDSGISLVTAHGGDASYCNVGEYPYLATNAVGVLAACFDQLGNPLADLGSFDQILFSQFVDGPCP